ncbi:MAG: polysaccharide biosynthesis/export family protein [Cyanobacteria bacterium J06597_1]
MYAPKTSAFTLLEEHGLVNQQDSTGLPNPEGGMVQDWNTIQLSPGDRIELTVPADTEALFSGPYEIERDGTIHIPFVGPVSVRGLTLTEVESLLVQTFETQELFLPGVVASVRVLNYGPATVHISGAVFDPGTAIVNQPPLEVLTGGQDSIAQIPGDAPRRLLTDAIRAAGGITPVADLSDVRLIRGSHTQTVDLRGVFDGTPFENPFVFEGDRIVVPEQEFVADYVRPSPLTPPTVQVFISATTVPATTNSQANGEGVLEFPYGSHFSQALGPANCLGGTSATNSRRSAVLVRTNRHTGEVFALDRRVEHLARDSHAADENPFLMPGDLVACYDSAVTNFSDVLRIVGQVILPIGLFWSR